MKDYRKGLIKTLEKGIEIKSATLAFAFLQGWFSTGECKDDEIVKLIDDLFKAITSSSETV